jgi:glucan phosphorylase
LDRCNYNVCLAEQIHFIQHASLAKSAIHFGVSLTSCFISWRALLTPSSVLQEIKAKADKSKDGEEEEDEVPEPVPASPPPAPLVRMAYLSVIGGHTVNGVAEIHSEIVKDDVSNWPSSLLSNVLCRRV